jgi:hypothetical protein
MLLVAEATAAEDLVELESIEDRAVLTWCWCVAWSDVRDVVGVGMKFVDGQRG